MGKIGLNGCCICADRASPSVPPEKLIISTLIGRQLAASANQKAGPVCVDIDGIEMTEGNYIESRWWCYLKGEPKNNPKIQHYHSFIGSGQFKNFIHEYDDSNT